MCAEEAPGGATTPASVPSIEGACTSLKKFLKTSLLSPQSASAPAVLSDGASDLFGLFSLRRLHLEMAQGL